MSGPLKDPAGAVLLTLILPACHVPGLPGSPALPAMLRCFPGQMFPATASERSEILHPPCWAEPQGCRSFEGESSWGTTSFRQSW